jgi:hypothetical protein
LVFAEEHVSFADRTQFRDLLNRIIANVTQELSDAKEELEKKQDEDRLALQRKTEQTEADIARRIEE